MYQCALADCLIVLLSPCSVSKNFIDDLLLYLEEMIGCSLESWIEAEGFVVDSTKLERSKIATKGASQEVEGCVSLGT